MTRRFILALLACAVLSHGFSLEEQPRVAVRPGEGAVESSRDATVLSMLGWGVGLAVGIAVLCALIPSNSGDSGH